MLFGGTFSESVVQVSVTVASGVLIAFLIAAVRFLLHVRDSVRTIGKAVNHRPPDEPGLYDLVLEGNVKQAETARLQQQIGETVAKHVRDDENRFALQDRVLDEVRGIVIDLRDKVDQLPTE